MQEIRVQSLGQADLLEEEMATHSNILAWEILWTEESGRLQSMVLPKVGHDLATKPLPLIYIPEMLYLLFPPCAKQQILISYLFYI